MHESKVIVKDELDGGRANSLGPDLTCGSWRIKMRTF